MNTTFEERRSHPRSPADLTVQYSSDSLDLSGVARNLSPTGLFVESDLLDLVGTRASLRLSDGEGRWLIATGEVVRTVCSPRVDRPGMGIRFTALGERAAAWLRGYCSGLVGVGDDDGPHG